MKILGMGMPELLIILVVILLIFGPKNLPKLGSAMGKTVKNLREGMMSDENKPEVEEAVDEVEEAASKKTVKVKKAVAEKTAEAEEEVKDAAEKLEEE